METRLVGKPRFQPRAGKQKSWTTRILLKKKKIPNNSLSFRETKNSLEIEESKFTSNYQNFVYRKEKSFEKGISTIHLIPSKSHLFPMESYTNSIYIIYRFSLLDSISIAARGCEIIIIPPHPIESIEKNWFVSEMKSLEFQSS